jgi:SAM-dependent methyltransferase
MGQNDQADPERRRGAIRDHYARAATAPHGGCCGGGSGSADLGYCADELQSVPEAADLGLGCGNPQALAALREGERVLDLGSGGGLDCFLAARRVGPSGRVIGVDMTPAMLARARAHAAGQPNVEFRLGEIEHLPVADASVDVILSNCVINLSSAKDQVCREAWRVLAPGGRLAIRDVVAIAAIPDALREDLAAHASCIAGAVSPAELERLLADAGFVQVRIEVQPDSARFIRDWSPGAERYVASATIQARKPG